MVATKATTLHEKVVEVALAIRNIEKGGRNSAQNYSYVMEADVVRRVWPELLERGLMFYPSTRQIQQINEFPSKSGTPSFLTTITSTWILTDGKDEIRVASAGQGTDTGGDKGMYKAMTGDKKYAVLQLLGIATGDDPEVATADESAATTARPKGLTDSQRELLFVEAKKAGFSGKDDKLGEEIFRITQKRSLKDMTNDDLDKVLASLREMAKMVAATGGEVV